MFYQIPLKSGHVALVDKIDYEKVKEIKWHFDRGYAVNRNLKPYQSMHRFILGMPKNGKVTDHINCNGLDNRRKNLRQVSRSINGLNRKRLSKRNKTGATGIQYYPNLKKWRAVVVFERKPIHLGLFSKKSDASKVYNKFKKELIKRSLS